MISGELSLYDAEGFFGEVIYAVRVALGSEGTAPLETLFSRYGVDLRGVATSDVLAELEAFERSRCNAFKESGPAVLYWPDCPAEQCPAYATCPYAQLVFVS